MKRIVMLAISAIVSFAAVAQVRVNAEDAKQHIGEVVTICGKIFSGKYLQSSKTQPTLLNLGGAYPNQLVTIAIFEIDRKNFPFKPEEYYPNTEVCVTGKLIDYKGMPEVVVQSPDQIKLQINTANNTGTPVNPKSVPKPVVPSQTDMENAFDVKLTHDVNLRAGPGLDYASIEILLSGSEVTVLKSSNGWSYVTVKKAVGTPVRNASGYIKNSVLK